MQPGAVVTYREREWIVLPAPDDEVLLLRPLTGTSDDAVAVHRRLSELIAYSLEWERVAPAQFPLPSPDEVGSARDVRLLWQAARLLLREGAAPFRSLGRVSIRPRAYQLVPLLMALRLDPVRLLIADDVGVGKTIEAGLIARELWERGEIRRLAVLCPPYLCDQWQGELNEKLGFDAVVIGPQTLRALERETPPGRSVYEHFPVQVLSIDWVKLERNRHQFLVHRPDLVIVDEAHGVTPSGGRERHLRYQLVRELASDVQRHLILLTATPHSGIRASFGQLLGLLDERFSTWEIDRLTEEQRATLARHLVQRTRADLRHRWGDADVFPTREPQDATYTLSPAYRALFEAVHGFCTEIVRSGEALQEHRRRMRWWSALVLLRCVMSSPRAAVLALERRRKDEPPDSEDESVLLGPDGQVPVVEPSDAIHLDEIPTPVLDRAVADLADSDRRRLAALHKQAAAIGPEHDTKLQRCVETTRRLLDEGFHPVIWCTYVDTAEYVAEHLRAELADDYPGLQVECLTGRVGEEERRQRVAGLLDAPRRLLVATDCLSEGINLQEGFDAVLHYDLPWNPNRLEQREGRVDRYGQPRDRVRAIRFYGQDNPVDGAVISVLLDKAREIRRTLGIYVPVPEDERTLAEVLVHRLFLRGASAAQLALPLGPDPVGELHHRWDIDVEREKVSRTVFAQRALDPGVVARELEACDAVLGDPDAVRRFLLDAAQAIGLLVAPDPRQRDVWTVRTDDATLDGVPDDVRAALPRPKGGRWQVTFTSPGPTGVTYLGRNHPAVTALARHLFERAFARVLGPSPAQRIGVLRTRRVERLTTLVLLRARYHLAQPGRPVGLSEEVLVTGWRGQPAQLLAPGEALDLLERVEPDDEVPRGEQRELVEHALQRLQLLLDDPETSPFARLLSERADELLAAHRRVRQEVGERVRGLRVHPYWPPDVLALLVLQPVVSR